MPPQIIFVGGIHGAGKTEFCKQLALQLHIDHISASNLIRQSGLVPSNGQKQVDQVELRQNLLIQALQNYESDSRIFLDGHFCLLDTKSRIQPIPLATFEQIDPKAVIVVRDEPEIIFDRLKNRDNITSYTLEFIAEFQISEVNYAKEVAHTLALPILVRTPQTDTREIFAFMNSY